LSGQDALRRPLADLIAGEAAQLVLGAVATRAAKLHRNFLLTEVR
jgi:hypothetical protein